MFYVHEEFPGHEKLEPLEDDARAWADCLAVWLAVGCDCRQRLSDGRVTRARLERITPLGKRAVAVGERLVELGLWEREGDDFQFHDWGDVQETKAQIQKRRLKWKMAKRDRRESAADASVNSESDSVGVSTSESTSDSNPDYTGEPPPDSGTESQTNRRGHGKGELEFNSLERAGAVPPDPLEVRASRGFQRLNAVNGAFFNDPPNGKWRDPYAFLGARPEGEWTNAARVLAIECQKSGMRRTLTPQHVADYWRLYSVGETPGAKSLPAKARPLRGMAQLPPQSEYDSEAANNPEWLTQKTEAS